jgi:ectoine hydroxylase-related dioxygenase (phytanoyl-CoA dioxygenase family)
MNRTYVNIDLETRYSAASSFFHLSAPTAFCVDVALIGIVWLLLHHHVCLMKGHCSSQKQIAATQTVGEGNSSLYVPYRESIVRH